MGIPLQVHQALVGLMLPDASPSAVFPLDVRSCPMQCASSTPTQRQPQKCQLKPCYMQAAQTNQTLRKQWDGRRGAFART
eukprot:3488846-Amphidinium_carterae.1